jgi:hypothetical protein
MKTLKSGSVFVLDVFVPQSSVHPEIQHTWIEKGTFIVDAKKVSLRDKRSMISNDCEQRTQEFTHEDGQTFDVTTNKYFISPKEVKQLLEQHGVRNIQIFSRNAMDIPLNPDDYNPVENFFVVGNI